MKEYDQCGSVKDGRINDCENNNTSRDTDRVADADTPSLMDFRF